jgi:hypothetical protein
VSALEQLAYTSRNRRSAERLLVAGSVVVIFGRGEGRLVDLSQRGARIRHSAPVRRGAAVRVSFEWQHARFSATAEVLSSRMVSIDAGLSYESRVRFTFVDDESERVLAIALEGIAGRATRRWVANLHGWSDESHPEPTPFPTNSYIRCRLLGNRWEIKRTTDPIQPVDGFAVPSDSPDTGIETLCDNYSRGNADERLLIRLLAAAAIESQTQG